MKVIIGIIVVIALGIGYNLFIRDYNEEGAMTDTSAEMDSMESNSDMQMEAADSSSMSDDDLEGIHIMGNGDVMLGDGRVLEDATITGTGLIQLSDGRTITPMADYRQ